MGKFLLSMIIALICVYILFIIGTGHVDINLWSSDARGGAAALTGFVWFLCLIDREMKK